MGAFFSAIGGWFMKNPLALVLIFMGVFCGMVVISKDATIKEIRSASAAKDTRITTLTTALGQARANVASLSGSLATHNAAIKDMVGKASLLDARFDTVMAQLAANQTALNGKITTIRNAPAPADKCKGASDLIRSSIQ